MDKIYMNIRIISVFLCFFMIASHAKIPDDFMFHDHPINPLCFFYMADDSGLLNIKKCSAENSTYIITGHDKDLIKDGYTGYDWQDPESSNSSQGYSYYKLFEAGNNLYWLYAINNGGGTGNFTAINLVKRKNKDYLTIKTLAGGDRCNGGIDDVSIKNNQLTFSVNLTPSTLIALSNKPDSSIKAYDDIAACAVCCVAKAFYTTNSDYQLQLKYVVPIKTQNIDEMPDQGTYQACFNQLFDSYTLGKNQLNQEQLEKFIGQFKQICIKNK
jgi:hypothetical protein